MEIPFNKPLFLPESLAYVEAAFRNGYTAGGGAFGEACQRFFAARFGFENCLLTHSCTGALEMAALLADIGPGDEVILPSFTFTSTANAFALRSADLVFADSREDSPHLDPRAVEELITPRTKAIVCVHYGGVACDMDRLCALADRHGLLLIEDAAQAIDSFYKGKPLGSFGHFAAFSFHETKNISCGEGGLLVVRDQLPFRRAEILWEKGTNRSAFHRKEAEKYTWMDLGSSFLASDITAACLLAQLEAIDTIQARRVSLWNSYLERLSPLAGSHGFQLPVIGPGVTGNGHIFHMVFHHSGQRDHILNELRRRGFLAVFHYQALHASPFFRGRHRGGELLQARRYEECLLRLPLFYDLRESDLEGVCLALEEIVEAPDFPGSAPPRGGPGPMSS